MTRNRNNFLALLSHAVRPATLVREARSPLLPKICSGDALIED
jgi:hypothetical protein